MQEDADIAPTKRRYRFSLATLLLLITAAAVLLTAWKIWSYEPPTYRIPLYEKAEGTRKSWIDVGPNRVRLATIARNDRDGTLHVEDGEGHAVTQSRIPDAGTIAGAGSWLDVAEIRLSPGPENIELIDVRIFDTKTRALISEIDPAYGWRITDRNAVQLYGFGKALPQQLDVWFRLNSYGPDAPMVELEPKAGARCNLAGATFTLNEIRDGQLGFSSNKFVGTPIGKGATVSVSITTQQINERGARNEIIAVSQSGETFYPNAIQFLTPQQALLVEPVFFDLALKDLDHFEIRSFGGRHRFFFEDVRLPNVSKIQFGPPPIAKVKIDGQAIERQLVALAPLEIKLATYPGVEFGGIAVNEQRATLMRPSFAQGDPKKQLTIAYVTQGFNPQLLNFQYLDRTTKKQPVYSNRALGGTSRHGGGFISLRWPLERLGEVDVTLASPAATNSPGPAASTPRTDTAGNSSR